MKDIVSIIFGDSIAYGVGDKKYYGWVNRLRNKVNDNNFIFNLGIPGQDSNDILNRFEQELINRFNYEDIFNLIFLFGVNDSKYLDYDNEYINIFKKNVQKIIDISIKYTKNIYFLGLINPDTNIRTNHNTKNVLLIDSELKYVCKENNVSYIELNKLIIGCLNPRIRQ